MSAPSHLVYKSDQKHRLNSLKGAAENYREDGRFIDSEARQEEIRRHRISCSYMSRSLGGGVLPSYGNLPPAEDPGEDGKEEFIQRLLDRFDDHNILHDLPETEENSQQLQVLRKRRQAYNDRMTNVLKEDHFSTLNMTDKQILVRALKQVHCPRCLQRIDFETEVRYSQLLDTSFSSIRFEGLTPGMSVKRVFKPTIVNAVSLRVIQGISLHKSQDCSRNIGQA